MAATLIALLPLSSLLALLLLDRLVKMRQLRNEKRGMPVEAVLMELMLAIQQHRGMAGAYLSGNASFRTKQPPAKAGGFKLRTESPDTRRLNDAS